MTPRPPSAPLFPYTTLFRSLASLDDEGVSTVLTRAIGDERGLGGSVEVSPEAMAHLLRVAGGDARRGLTALEAGDRKSTRLNSSHSSISYAVFCLKKKKTEM